MRAKNKRRRHDSEPNSKPTGSANTSHPKGPDKGKGKGKVRDGVKIFDVGFGAKSAFNIKAVTPNRFTILHEEEIGGLSSKKQDQHAPVVQDHAARDFVPDTQTDDMAI